ncbi:hypothetical protein DPMN_152760 [Dreissena polymorpha]|uniref:Uncharacterized protein n=1 Tax=Dreissena polymorpha TaxID=45954 RepID=A0A9D4FMG3_DREPO|nr:hypothetical protein DPMN_152760 [Dreissena polymorpha]
MAIGVNDREVRTIKQNTEAQVGNYQLGLYHQGDQELAGPLAEQQPITGFVSVCQRCLVYRLTSKYPIRNIVCIITGVISFNQVFGSSFTIRILDQYSDIRIIVTIPNF